MIMLRRLTVLPWRCFQNVSLDVKGSLHDAFETFHREGDVVLALVAQASFPDYHCSTFFDGSCFLLHRHRSSDCSQDPGEFQGLPRLGVEKRRLSYRRGLVNITYFWPMIQSCLLERPRICQR